MRIDQEFTVTVPLERAWAELTDLRAIAPCMPGAQLTDVKDEVYSGTIKIKIGPIVAQYVGTARFTEKDEAEHRAVIDASGRDSRGAGNASAVITAVMREVGEGTVVNVGTDLKISGKVAQLGGGMIKEVSTKLLGQFVGCLEKKLTEAPQPSVDPSSSATDNAEPGTRDTAPEAGVRLESAQTTPEVAPLDILDLARGSIYKRLIPLIVVLAVVVVLIVLFAVM